MSDGFDCELALTSSDSFGAGVMFIGLVGCAGFGRHCNVSLIEAGQYGGEVGYLKFCK